MMLRRTGVIFSIAFCALTLLDCRVSFAAQGTATTTASQAAYDRGKALFKSNCSFCHGVDATGGNGGPDLIRSVLVNHDENGNLIAPTVHNGRPGKGMPAFSDLTDAQIADIVSFLHQENLRLRLRRGYKLGDVLVGNADAGKEFFQTHCSRCHSANGDLKDIATRYDPSELQQLWLDPSNRKNDDDKNPIPAKTVDITAPGGRKFSGTLARMDEFNVSWMDANGYHSLPLEHGVVAQVHDPLAAHEELLKHLTNTNMHDVTAYLETLK
jgi:mono/diheme cytochrome c family protein